MKRMNFILFIMLGGFTFVRAQYRISYGVFGNGGAVLISGSNSINGTLGQTLCGEMSSSTHAIGVGFWYVPHTLVTSIVEKPGWNLPESYGLFQSYTNPFNPSCMIGYALPEISEVTVTVFDMMGREVARLFQGQDAPGVHKVTFKPERLPSGMYFYRMTAKSSMTGMTFNEVKKAMYVK